MLAEIFLIRRTGCGLLAATNEVIKLAVVKKLGDEVEDELETPTSCPFRDRKRLPKERRCVSQRT
jgi:hypothetical protein